MSNTQQNIKKVPGLSGSDAHLFENLDNSGPSKPVGGQPLFGSGSSYDAEGGSIVGGWGRGMIINGVRTGLASDGATSQGSAGTDFQDMTVLNTGFGENSVDNERTASCSSCSCRDSEPTGRGNFSNDSAPSATSTSSGGFPGPVSSEGFQSLPQNGLTREQVDLSNGQVTRSIPLVGLRQLGVGLSFELSHASQKVGSSGSAGTDWRHNYEMHISYSSSTPNVASYINGRGQQFDFYKDGSNWVLRSDYNADPTKDANSYFDTFTLTNPSTDVWKLTTHPDETVWEFDTANSGRLVSITDRFANDTTLQYTSGKLTSVTDAEGRQVTFTYNGDDLIETITDPNSNSTLLSYDSNDRIEMVSGPEGCTITLGYTGDMITSITDARGNSTQYTYNGSDQITSFTDAEGNVLTYAYSLVQERLTASLLEDLDTTTLTLPDSTKFEYRFDNAGNLWRAISNSGHTKRYVWDDHQRFLYSSEGFPFPQSNAFISIDNSRNRFTRRTIDAQGRVLAQMDSTGKVNGYVYDNNGQMIVAHDGIANHSVQGNWPEEFGKDGYLLCAFDDDTSTGDVYVAPSYLTGALGTDFTTVSGFSRWSSVSASAPDDRYHDPRVPVRAPDNIQRLVGFWRSSSGSSFDFTINVPSGSLPKKFNLSLYTNAASQEKDTVNGETGYHEHTGRNVEITVTAKNGTQSYFVTNNAPGVWVTFPVEVDSTESTIEVTVESYLGVVPQISAIAFDPFEDRRTFFEYTSGQVTKVTDGLGNETAASYLSDGSLDEITDARGEVTGFEYPGTYKYQKTKVIDPLLNETLLEFDANGNLVKVTDANTHVTEMTYDGKNRVTLIKDPLLNETTFDYDGNGNLLSIEDAEGRATHFEYTLNNRLKSITNPLNQTIELTYDENNRLKTVTDPKEQVTTYHYNEDGLLSQVDQPDGESATFAYDALDQLVALTGPNGNQSVLTDINLLGAANLFRDPGAEINHGNGNVRHWRREDGTENVSSTSQYHSGQASLSLDATGQSWRQLNLDIPPGVQFLTSFWAKRDTGGDAELMPECSIRNIYGADKDVYTSFSSDGVKEFEGNALTLSDTNWNQSALSRFEIPGDSQTTAGKKSLVHFDVELRDDEDVWLDDFVLNMISTAFKYDKAGRFKRVLTPDGAEVTLIRDRFGRVTGWEDPRGEQVELVYDALDRVVEVNSSLGNSVSYSYDENGNLTSFVDARSKTTSFEYEELNRLKKITYPDTTTEVFAYDYVGNLASYTDNLTQVRQFTYDANDRLTEVEYMTDNSTVEFAYDDVGNVTLRTERNGDTVAFTYDDLDRVTRVVRTAAMGNSTPEWEHHYAYDANGNRISLKEGSTPTTLWEAGRYQSIYGTAVYGTDTYSGGYDAMDRLAGFGDGSSSLARFDYDNEGRRTKITYSNGVETDATYDISGRLMSLVTNDGSSDILSIEYRYDLASNRVGQVSNDDTFDYKIDRDGRLVGEAVNRFVENSSRDFRKGELSSAQLSGDSCELLELNDDFSGDELNCDRWKVGYRVGTAPGAGELDEYYGTEIRQKEGLHMVFPRGFSNFIPHLTMPPVDILGTPTGDYGFLAEHREQLSGDFDISVDFENLQMTGTSSRAFSLTVSDASFEKGGSANYFQVQRFNAGYQVFNNTTPLGYFTQNDASGKLRLVRSGFGSTPTLTAYYWSGSSWTPIVSGVTWTHNPLYVSLDVSGTNITMNSGTFQNFVFDSSDDYVTAGEYESQTYDAGRTVDWDEISWDETLPSGCDIELQIAVSANEDGPWTFKGPDGTAGTKFSTSGTAVYTGTSGRYARYKAFLTGNGTATPTLENVHISYSGNVDSQFRGFTFDAAGNMTVKKVVTDSATVTETRSFNDLNEITQNVIGGTTWTYTHDANGNLTHKNDTSDYWEYVWNEDNRLTEVKLNTVTQVTYEYDSVGRLLKRVEGSLTTKFEWDGWDLVREVKSGSVSETTDYYVPQGEVHSFERGGSVYHLHGDGLSSTQMVTNSSGTEVARLIYGAWGEVLDETETISGDLDVAFVGGFGVRRDQTTGLILMRHRFCDPTLGRFINRDPIGHVGGQNLYRYAGNNPAAAVDPLGLYFRISWGQHSYSDALAVLDRLVHRGNLSRSTITDQMRRDFETLGEIWVSTGSRVGPGVVSITGTANNELARQILQAAASDTGIRIQAGYEDGCFFGGFPRDGSGDPHLIDIGDFRNADENGVPRQVTDGILSHEIAEAFDAQSTGIGFGPGPRRGAHHTGNVSQNRASSPYWREGTGSVNGTTTGDAWFNFGRIPSLEDFRILRPAGKRDTFFWQRRSRGVWHTVR